MVIAVLVATLLVGVVAGCGKPKGPKKGGQLVFGMIGDPVTFNPILTTDVPSDTICARVFNGLVQVNEKMEMVPDLAESWDYSADGLTWTFHLKKGVKWHDGKPFTAADVKYTYDAIKSPEYTGVRATDFKPITKIEAPDDNTVVLTLEKPYAPLLTVLTQGIIPKHLFETTPIAQMKENPASMTPVGTGPFIYKEWAKGQYILVEKNPNFFGDGPYVDKVIYKFYQDEQVELAALEKGDIDYISSLPPEEIDRIKKDYATTFNFVETPRNGYSYIGLKQTNPILKEKLVRQALAYGTNRDGIVKDVLKGHASVPNANIMPESWAYAGDQLNPYKYDPEKAKSLLEEAGWKVGKDGIRVKDGKPLTFKLITSTGNKNFEAALNIIQQNWKDIGVDVKIEYIEWSVLCAQYLDVAKFESYALGWSLGLDPDFYIYFHSSSAVDEKGQLMGFNDVEFKRPELDQLLEEGRTTMDQAKRKEIYAKAQKIVNEELPYVFLYQMSDTAAMNKKIQGVTWSPLGPLFMEKWYIDEAAAKK